MNHTLVVITLAIPALLSPDALADPQRDLPPESIEPAEPSPPVAPSEPVTIAPIRPGEPGGAQPGVVAVPEELTAARVAGAPVPGQESGRIDRADRGPSVPRRIGRALLFVPRGFLEIAMAPVRGTVWAVERYALVERARRVFFNEEETIGLHPMASFESDHGFNAGARFVMKFEPDHDLEVFAGAGGRHSYLASASLFLGESVIDRLSFQARARLEKRSSERFFGVGNADESPRPAMPVDALSGDIAVESRYRLRLARTSLTTDVRVTEPFHVRIAGAVGDVEREARDSPPIIDEVFVPATLIAFDGYRYGYGELELRWDDRDRVTRWEPPALATRGSLLSAYAGYTAIADTSDFVRYGVDLQHFIRLGSGPRVLAARARGEAVTAGRGEVPFTELPFLGGSEWLRGYETERFRDRVATVVTVEYEWGLSSLFVASAFADVGRVHRGLDDLSLDDLRVGFGAGIEAHTRGGFVARASLATSIDGGVFPSLYLESTFAVKPRVERR